MTAPARPSRGSTACRLLNAAAFAPAALSLMVGAAVFRVAAPIDLQFRTGDPRASLPALWAVILVQTAFVAVSACLGVFLAGAGRP